MAIVRLVGHLRHGGRRPGWKPPVIFNRQLFQFQNDVTSWPVAVAGGLVASLRRGGYDYLFDADAMQSFGSR